MININKKILVFIMMIVAKIPAINTSPAALEINFIRNIMRQEHDWLIMAHIRAILNIPQISLNNSQSLVGRMRFILNLSNSDIQKVRLIKRTIVIYTIQDICNVKGNFKIKIQWIADILNINQMALDNEQYHKLSTFIKNIQDLSPSEQGFQIILQFLQCIKISDIYYL